jgi:hypothetical protein
VLAARLVVTLTGLATIGTFALLQPGYLVVHGFPVDDAWVHAVHGRALAGSGWPAFNPGEGPAARPPLGTVLPALAHLLSAEPATIVTTTKLLGWALHLLAALLLLEGLRAGAAPRPETVLGAALVAAHPGLLAGAMSGTETSVAALVTAALVLAAGACRNLALGVLSALAPLAAPPLAVAGVVLVLARHAATGRRPLAGGLLAWAAGSAAGLTLLALWSGGPGGAAVAGGAGSLRAIATGFTEVLARFPVTDASLPLAAAALAAVLAAWRPGGASERTGAAALLAGLAGCAASFLLDPPRDPGAFEEQRRVLPLLPLLVGPLPGLLARLAGGVVTGRALGGTRIALAVLLVAGIATATPLRHHGLANDARNLDDLAVAMGRALAPASSVQVVWGLDAGALRYFGGARVVDLRAAVGQAQAGVAPPPPHFFELVPGRVELVGPPPPGQRSLAFRTSTPYTLESGSPLLLPRPAERFLLACEDPAWPGRLRVDGRNLLLRCAPTPPLLPGAPRR